MARSDSLLHESGVAKRSVRRRPDQYRYESPKLHHDFRYPGSELIDHRYGNCNSVGGRAIRDLRRRLAETVFGKNGWKCKSGRRSDDNVARMGNNNRLWKSHSKSRDWRRLLRDSVFL